MTTDNVLVSREWLAALIAKLTEIQDTFNAMQIAIGAREYEKAGSFRGGLYAACDLIHEVLSMPDYTESERDVEVAAKSIVEQYHNPRKDEWKTQIDLAQAAINALRYRKEGIV